MSNQGLLLGEGQLEFPVQILFELAFDSLSFRLRSDVSDAPIVGIPSIFQPSVVGVAGIKGGYVLRLLAHLHGVFAFPFLPPNVGKTGSSMRGDGVSSLLAFGVRWYEHLLDIFI